MATIIAMHLWNNSCQLLADGTIYEIWALLIGFIILLVHTKYTHQIWNDFDHLFHGCFTRITRKNRFIYLFLLLFLYFFKENEIFTSISTLRVVINHLLKQIGIKTFMIRFTLFALVFSRKWNLFFSHKIERDIHCSRFSVLIVLSAEFINWMLT